ncbi:MAG: AMP-binding protein [Gammaproteobacteria bacterium]
MNLVQVLLDQARVRGTQPAIIESRGGRDSTMDFATLAAQSARAAVALARRGVTPGDHVLFLAPMSAGLYVWLLGTLRLGAVAMFLDPSAGRAHVAACLRRVTPRAFVASPRAHLLRCVVGELRRVPVQLALGAWLPLTQSCAAALRGADATDEAVEPCADDHPALVTFTSGSTGAPKAVVRSHGFLLAQHRALERALTLRAGERDLTTLPIFLLANLASGVTSVIAEADLRRPGHIDGRTVLAQLRRLAPQSCGAAPAFVERLCEACEADGGDLAPLARLHVGGGPVFPNLVERARRRLPQGELIAVYGSTEAEPIAHVAANAIAPADYRAMRDGAGLLAGVPVADITLAILPNRWGEPCGPYTDAAFAAACLPSGEVGEIVVSGEHVVRGYLGGIGDAETKFDVGGTRWHRTGDLGRLDADGRLWLLGRCAAGIDDARGRLYPFAVECAAQQLAGVRRAALALRAGRRVLAYETTDAGPDETTVGAALAWAGLDHVVRVPHIPLDARHNSKIDYGALARALDARGVDA